MRYEDRKEYAIVCDGCGCRGPWAPSVSRQLAEGNGWRVDISLCPECQFLDKVRRTMEEV
jgi:hypothetical protein